jgi:hypothetical protein
MGNYVTNRLILRNVSLKIIKEIIANIFLKQYNYCEKKANDKNWPPSVSKTYENAANYVITKDNAEFVYFTPNEPSIALVKYLHEKYPNIEITHGYYNESSDCGRLLVTKSTIKEKMYTMDQRAKWAETMKYFFPIDYENYLKENEHQKIIKKINNDIHKLYVSPKTKIFKDITIHFGAPNFDMSKGEYWIQGLKTPDKKMAKHICESIVKIFNKYDIALKYKIRPNKPMSDADIKFIRQ